MEPGLTKEQFSDAVLFLRKFETAWASGPSVEELYQSSSHLAPFLVECRDKFLSRVKFVERLCQGQPATAGLLSCCTRRSFVNRFGRPNYFELANTALTLTGNAYCEYNPVNHRFYPLTGRTRTFDLITAYLQFVKDNPLPTFTVEELQTEINYGYESDDSLISIEDKAAALEYGFPPSMQFDDVPLIDAHQPNRHNGSGYDSSAQFVDYIYCGSDHRALACPRTRPSASFLPDGCECDFCVRMN